MKPSIILYKTLPDDLLHRPEAHFTVTRYRTCIRKRSRDTRRHLPARKAFWAPAKPLTARCWKNAGATRGVNHLGGIR